MTDDDQNEFDTCELRDGETRDDNTHARRNAEQLRMAREILNEENDAEDSA